ncbi:MAG: hypothetical protein GYB66_10750 [Chloroflexi bacterium]|nr:hypothetical protein [Chloroflexota bacterium]
MHILIPDNLHKAGLAVLEASDAVTYDAPGKMSRDAVLDAAGSAHAMIVRSGTQVDAELLKAASQLTVVVRAGVGVDNIDLDEAHKRGVTVMNTPQGNTVATAEHTLALMLALARHIPQAQASMLDGQWERKRFTGTELRGKTLGLIGLGRVGQAVARRALAFEMTVVAHDPFISPSTASELGVALLEPDEVFAQADYLSLHTVVTPETRDMINASTLAKMKDGVRIVNAARGVLINDHDLAAAINQGKVAGAALDVYAEEPPPPDHPLIGLPGVIDTPHLGASTVEAQEAVAVEAAHKVLNALLHATFEDVVKA